MNLRPLITLFSVNINDTELVANSLSILSMFISFKSLSEFVITYLIIYFVVFASVHWEKWIIAAIAFSINSGAYVSEIIRAGILSIDKGQTEAGRSLGLTGAQTMLFIVIPQAVKNIFPAMCNEFITLIKETAIVGYVGLVDIQKAGDKIKSKTFEAFMPLIATAIIYFVLIKILTTVLGIIEKRLRKSDIR